MLHVAATPGHLVFLSWLPDRPGLLPTVDDFTEIAARLAELGAVPLLERVYGTAAVAPEVLARRQRAAAAPLPPQLAPTWVEGAPCAAASVAGIHVVAARAVTGWEPLTLPSELSGVLVCSGDGLEYLALRDGCRPHRASSPTSDAAAAMEQLRAALAAHGWGFQSVVRTWFYLRDILAWYGPFNALRNELFATLGLDLHHPHAPLPASTGIEGGNLAGSWCTLDALAARTAPGSATSLVRVVNPCQNEAPEYGSAFSRAIAVATDAGSTVLVSGTAAIDSRGRTTSVGSFPGQVADTLDAVAALLAAADSTLADIVQATAFVKHADDAPLLAAILAERGLAHLPVVTVRADVCRPELLFELDAVAVGRRSRA